MVQKGKGKGNVLGLPVGRHIEMMRVPSSNPTTARGARERISLEADTFRQREVTVERDENGLQMFNASLERTMKRSLLLSERGGWGGPLNRPGTSSTTLGESWKPKGKLVIGKAGEMVYVSSNQLRARTRVVNPIDLTRVHKTGRVTALSARSPQSLTLRTAPPLGGGASTARESLRGVPESLDADQLTPEIMANLQKLPEDFGRTLDELLGIATDKRKLNMASIQHHQHHIKANQSGRTSPAHRARLHDQNMRAKLKEEHGEGEMWIMLARKYWEKDAKRSKDTFLAYAAESAFVKQAQFMHRPSTLSRRDFPILVIPHQWLHDQLTNLTLIACQIPELPLKFGILCPNLVQLFLDHNRIASIPDSIIFAEGLRDIGLTTNQLSAFPTRLCSLRHLQTLSLQNNHIPSVPDYIGTCTSLVALYLAQNPIDRLPLTVGLLSKLVCLTIDPSTNLNLPDWGLHADCITLRDYYSVLLHVNVLRFRHTLHANFLRVSLAFRKFDADRSGDLDQAEVEKALQSMGVHFPNFGEMWIVIDKDGSGRIDYEEFLQMVRQERPTDEYESPEEVLLKGLAEQTARGARHES